MTTKEQILTILERELIPALGCTEPIAVAYCAAVARSHAGGQIQSIECQVSVNIAKNAASVAIPGTNGLCGVSLAAAVGAIGGNPDMGLEVIRDLTPQQVSEAQELCSSKACTASIYQEKIPLFIQVTVRTDLHTASAIIQGSHTNIVYLQQDDKVLLDQRANQQEDGHDEDLYRVLSLESIWNFALTTPLKELSLLQQAIDLNSALCGDGLERSCGLEVGRSIQENIQKGIYSSDLCSYAMMVTAAGSDARMAGSSFPAMSNSGSGNQGLTCTMPVVAAAQFLEKDRETTLRAVTISNLCAIFIKSHLQRLSAVCGAIGAATGAGCGIVYLLGGSTVQMASVIKNTLGDLAGMFCDGAKGSCALKVSTCVNAAVQGAVLAMSGHHIQPTDGIVGHTEKDTIQNYARLSKDGMSAIDEVIMDIILAK